MVISEASHPYTQNQVLCDDRAVQTREMADQQYTIEHYLERSNRKTLPLDRRFVQRRNENNRPGPGPLGEFVRRSRETALDQYLWLHAVASSNNEFVQWN